MLKKIIIGLVAVFLLGTTGAYFVYQSVLNSLPKIITVKDYQPLLVSEVFDRNNKKIGEYKREKRTLVAYKDIPKNLVNAFLAAEDDQFFQHKGINPQAIIRATLANLKAGRSVQGGSTITQQVAKTLMLSSEKTLTRKLKDILLALEMEKNLSKEDILYLYLNQIYFGQGAYGVEQASQVYFKKTVKELRLPEMAILAGLPQAPSAYSPTRNPKGAKDRQSYVLRRMADVGFVKKEEAEAAVKEPVKVWVKENYEEFAPFYLETIRQILVSKLGEDVVLDKGIKVYTGLDLEKQKSAQDAVLAGLKELDKRQGFRGPLKHLDSPEKIAEFMKESRKGQIAEATPERTILPTGVFEEIVIKDAAKDRGAALPVYLKVGSLVDGVVDKLDDDLGLAYVTVPDSRGVIDISSMAWARPFDTDKKSEGNQIKKPSEALKVGDVIRVKITSAQYNAARLLEAAKKNKKLVLPNFPKTLELQLDQEPTVEGALLSFDQQTSDILAMVGGSNFQKSEFNRTIQAPRQTGSSFKSIVYASALDHGYTAATPIMDAPLVYTEGKSGAADQEGQEDDVKVWKPSNHSKSFGGDIIFRNALVKSLNIPTVKIIEDIKVPWAMEYARRLGIYNKLNPDFTLALGSSSVTLYEMTKVFSEFGRMGKRIHPGLIKKVVDRDGKVLLENYTLDMKFENETKDIEEDFEKRRVEYLAMAADPGKLEQFKKEDSLKAELAPNIFFNDPDQLIRPSTAYVITTLLRGVIEDSGGTGGAARALGRQAAGKTGTTNNYFDAWFMGYTPNIATGVWVGFDKEKSIGRGEVGGKSALPIWVDYMKAAHEGLPVMTFPIPEGITIVKIDPQTGKLASPDSKVFLEQAFKQGTEPSTTVDKQEEQTDFYKQDLSE